LDFGSEEKKNEKLNVFIMSLMDFDSFKRLLVDELFVDHLNKYLSLPIFGQRIVIKSNRTFIFDPQPFQYQFEDIYDEVIHWIWNHRCPYFFASRLYAQYKLTRLLLTIDLLKTGQIDAELAKKIRRVQKENFSKMSKFSSFCNFLGSCNSGGKHLVAFYFKLHMFLCNKNYESAVEILHQIKNEFLDEGSSSCLPKEARIEYERQQKSIAGRLIVVCKHVISRISLYWLPRYVLSKMDNHHSDDLDFASFSREPMKDSGLVFVNLLPPESDYDLQPDYPNQKTDDLPDKPIIPTVVRLNTPYHSDIGDSGVDSGSESDFSQRNISFSHSDDLEYRTKMIHFRNSLLSDKFAAGPFLSYLQKFSDKEGQLCLRFWMQLEMLRLNFQSYHQRDLLGSMNSILVTCKYHTHLIPGVFDLLNDIERLDILRLMTFPWQFRYIQKLCMEELYIKWCDFILTGIIGYLKILDKTQTYLA